MVDKKEPAKGWPVVKGEYDVGDAKSDVAVATCGSHFNQFPIKAGAAISGSGDDGGLKDGRSYGDRPRPARAETGGAGSGSQTASSPSSSSTC